MFDVDFHILNQKATPAIYADTLANRPAASFAGRLFVDTASPYGIYRDTGSTWVQIAGGGGGGTSTGINGLNGTTNIGLGGTLSSNTTIAQNSLNITFSKTAAETFNINSWYIFDYTDSTNNRHLIQPNGFGSLNIFAGNSTTSTNSLLQLQRNLIKTFFNGTGEYGINLDDTTGKFVLGDYNNDRKYNSFVVNDDANTFYLTTSFNQANTDQDLFYISNATSSIRFVKLGDFNNYTNGISLIVDDANNTIITNNYNGMNGIWVTPSFTIFGQANTTTKLYFSIDYGLNSLSLRTTSDISTGIELSLGGNYKLGCFNLGTTWLEIDNNAESFTFNTQELFFTGAALQSNTSGGNSGEHLVITLNGTQYKIALQNP